MEQLTPASKAFTRLQSKVESRDVAGLEEPQSDCNDPVINLYPPRSEGRAKTKQELYICMV